MHRENQSFSWLRNKLRTRNVPTQTLQKRNRRSGLSVENLEARTLLAVATFQDGFNGYEDTQDVVLYSRTPNTNTGTESGISVDQQDVGGVRQGLLQFGDIIGSETWQIPQGSTITEATLILDVFNDSNSSMQLSMYRMLTPWNELVATWNSFEGSQGIGGVQALEGEVEDLPPDAILFDASTGVKTFDVTTSVRNWAAGQANYGWLLENAATNGWDFSTSEASPMNRPKLEVTYTNPSGTGEFEFLNVSPVQAEGHSGTTEAPLQVSRRGGVTGAVSVDYTITAGSATAGVDFVAASGTLDFAAGETTQNVPVTINGDTDLEGLETVIVTLSNAQGGASINVGSDAATLTIGDDDALINEVLANVSGAGQDETNREYIELIGTPGADLTDYYFVVFESEEEEDAGTGSGKADLVISLADKTFGPNGLLVITGTSWVHTPDAGTNQYPVEDLDGVGGIIEDSSQTYALIRSSTPVVQDTDYDLDVYENANQVAIGEGVGLLDLDVLPAGAQIIDIVGIVEGQSGDRDRVATLAHPGVHVHQPEGFGGISSVASDAVTRRAGVTTPKSIGAWYNGDIGDADANPIEYPNGTTAISVVAPGGAVLTPGAPNILRNVLFTTTSVSINEDAGTVTLTVERTGDTSGPISVDWTTVDGTALAGSDYTGDQGVLHFAAADSSEDITVTILEDTDAEGFESFSVSLSNATAPFLVTVPTATVTINDADVEFATFQDFDDNGYSGTSDVYLNSLQPFDPFGFGATVVVDEEAGTRTGSDSRPSQGLLRFDDLFGHGADQIPVGSQIFGGFLTVNVVDPSSESAAVRLFRMLEDWDEGTATWNDPQGIAGGAIDDGVTPDDVEAAAEVDAIVTNPGGSGLVDIPLNPDTLQAWANGSAPNHGWAIISDSAESWTFASSDDFLSQEPFYPKLTIFYTEPSGEGLLSFSDTEYTVGESGTASIPVHRIGGTSGSVTVHYEITAGTGSLADINRSATGQLVFANGDLVQTIDIPIVNDTVLEQNETLTLILLEGGPALDRATTTLTFRDNDLDTFNPPVLLSEVFINSPGNDGTHEFLELTGTPGAGMGSLYVAVINGDVGEGEGSTDLIVDVGPFLNGASGQSLITALNDFDFSVPADTTQIPRAELDVEIVSNDTATYVLIYSPVSRMLTGRFDYDWDNDGSLDLPSGASIIDSIANDKGGVSDQTYGPDENRIVSTNNPDLFVADAVSRKRGNTDRNNASAWFWGDLLAAGDDPLVYDAKLNPDDPQDLNRTVGLPFPGAAMTPGELNTGTTVESPLVSLTSIVPNLPVGTVTLTFNGVISQVLDGGGAFGVSITDANGIVDPRVEEKPIVTGVGTNTLTVAFEGAGVVGGQLPPGDWQLNFVSTSLIGNGRAVDTANTQNATGSDCEFEFTQVGGLLGDVNLDKAVNGLDVDPFVDRLLSGVYQFEADTNGDTVVNGLDVDPFVALVVGAGGGTSAAATAGPEESAAAAAPAALPPRLRHRAMEGVLARRASRVGTHFDTSGRPSAWRQERWQSYAAAAAWHAAVEDAFADDGVDWIG